MLWFDFFFFWFIFSTSLNFSNQIEIFKPVYFFFGHLSIKKGKHLSTFLYPILSYSRWVPLDLCYPPATLPLPPNPHYAWILIISRFHFFLFILHSPGFEPPTSGSAYHCHYHLTMKAMGARFLILVLIISSSPQAPLI